MFEYDESTNMLTCPTFRQDLKSFADIESMTQHESESRITALSNLKSSPEMLAEEYPENAGEIFNVIQQSENVISKLRL